jgi:hypothetical protein
MERRVAIPPGRVTHSRDGPVHKGEATIRVRRIRRCALHTSTEITGPSLRKNLWECFSGRIAHRAQLRSPRGNGREDRAQRWSSGWRSRKNIFWRRPVHAVLVPAPPGRLTPGEPRSRGQAVGAVRMLEVGGSVAPATCENAPSRPPRWLPSRRPGSRVRRGSFAKLEGGEAKGRTVS